ncbi:MAG TPA: DUF4386 domain-containing protein [Rhodanobacteraceae bacterium]|nr:DUF4386 domain-containing protein [Rhodanobacteraceae bacterium]
MQTARNAGRTIAALLLVQMPSAAVVNFVLFKSMFGPPGYLEAASAHALDIRLGVVLGLVMQSLGIGIALAALPVFRRYSEAMALGVLALTIVGMSVAIVEYIHVLSMLSFSQAYANAGGTNVELFKTMGPEVASMRNWAHFTGLIIAGSFAFLLYGTLFRFALVPRVLAGFGMIAAALQMTSVGMPLFGQSVVFPMIAPLGLAHLALALWLIFKGLADPKAASPDVRI